MEAPIRVRRVDFDISSENHYVIVIHGTFDAPPPGGAPTWYQPPPAGEQNFCRKLSRLLALGPIGQDAVWRDLPCSALPGIPYPFHWDGSNTHAGRVTAAMKLHNLIDQIAQNDPAARIHLVAHSHGGNVLLKTIELYMAKLARRPKAEWHPAVAQRFWAAHRRSYELIKKWRRLELYDSWWRFFPFLVVYRGFNGQRVSGVKETYPWAHHQWLDTLLGLPAVRQRRFLSFRQATSPVTNALGSLVFLGTPFYIKKWQRHGFARMLLSVGVGVLLTYLFILAYTALWELLVLLMAGRPQEFYAESGPHLILLLNFLIATGIMLLVLVKQIMDATGNTVLYSGNLYHNPAFDWSPAMSALVIHAGKLDEASLALSMEPITRAYVFPHLTKLLKQTPWAPLPKAPTRYAPQRVWCAFLFHCSVVLVWDVLFFLPAAILSLFSHLIAPLVTGWIQQAVVAVSFGLSPGDLSYAYVYVDENLDMELATQQVDHWNVQSKPLKGELIFVPSPTPFSPLILPPVPVPHPPLQKLLAEVKTKSLKGELMPGYEDDPVEQPDWLEPKLLAEAKTKSLKGDLMPGYEDDTVEQPDWLKPVPSLPLSHPLSPPAALLTISPSPFLPLPPPQKLLAEAKTKSLKGELMPGYDPSLIITLPVSLLTVTISHPFLSQKLLAEAKTKSLKGELMPGYDPSLIITLPVSLLTVTISHPFLSQKLLAEAKTKSLKGELMPAMTHLFSTPSPSHF
ncbi:unnamed protein product [Closterium sp. NIES-64]|nr:unnamed protein product [Closterium sp. NIES-64]